MSRQYLKEAAASGDTKALIRYLRLHLGDGDEAKGHKEIDKSRIDALQPLLGLASDPSAYPWEAHAYGLLAHLAPGEGRYTTFSALDRSPDIVCASPLSTGLAPLQPPAARVNETDPSKRPTIPDQPPKP